MPGTVEDLPVSAGTLEERRVAALEAQARAMERSAQAAETFAALPAQGAPVVTSQAARAARFERVLCACLHGRVAAVQTVEGYLAFARELCDGVDRESAQG